jgi:hypothetical protein
LLLNAMRSPILFLVFNRPELTAQVFEAIRQARPPRLYVAADGPRPDRPGEKHRTEEVRKIATSVDWPCKVRTLFREQNLGCKMAVSGGITWFFEHESEGVILEDDVLPDPSFFPFCDELLERYRNDPKIMMISGSYFHGRHAGSATSYFFSRHTHIWGWATWRRAWKHYDPDMSQWPTLRETDFLRRACDGDQDCAAHWGRIFDATYNCRIDTWDYQWMFTSFRQSGLSVLPTKNLTKNIGFGADATHTMNGAGWQGRLRANSMSFPLRHPAVVRRDQLRDRWVERHVFGTERSIYARIRRRILTLPGLSSILRRLSSP